MPAGRCVNREALIAKASWEQEESRAVDSAEAALYGTDHGALGRFLHILLQPDNIPIAGMLLLVLFFTWVGFRQALRNDRLLEEGREEEILKEMQN